MSNHIEPIRHRAIQSHLMGEGDFKDLCVMYMRVNQVGEPGGHTWDFASTALGMSVRTLKRWKEEAKGLIESSQNYKDRMMARERALLSYLYEPLELAITELRGRLEDDQVRKAFTIKELLQVVNALSDKYISVSTLHLRRQEEIAEHQATMDTLDRIRDIFANADKRHEVIEGNAKQIQEGEKE